MRKPSADYLKAIAVLDAIYARLPTVHCQGRCSIACGPIILTDLEAERLRRATHRKPRTIATGTSERCIYLTPADRCSVYADRPLICRVWGVVKMLSCMHGCVPDRWLSDVEFLRVAQAVEQLGGGRVLRTSPDGLGHLEGERFGNFLPLRADQEIEADAERTRTLRALHGGRILAVSTKP